MKIAADVADWVKSALLFGVFSSVILMLAPQKSYEKHISLVVGMIFILLIIHPVMKFLNIDGSTYISYVQNFIMSDGYANYISDNEKELYGESIRVQLEAALLEGGYDVDRLRIYVDDEGKVYKIALMLEGEISNLNDLENYLNNVFGDSVEIMYE